MATYTRKSLAVCIALVSWFCMCFTSDGDDDVDAVIFDDYPIAEIDDRFAGVTIDTGIIRNRWNSLDLNSPKVQTLARGLSPCYIRMGGTDADFCIFSDNSIQKRHKRDLEFSKKKHWTNFTLTEDDWDKIHTFIQKVGWDLIFDLNALQRNGEEWDSRNARALMEYTRSKGYKVAGWELGNEPGEYPTMGLGYNVTADQFIQDFYNLSSLIKMQPISVQGSLLLGPSTISLVQTRVINFFTEFFKSGGGKVVTSPNFHHYYLNGREATFENLIDPNILNSLTTQLDIANEVAKKFSNGKKPWIGETASCWGGGAANLSNAYVAAFMWLDKLGLAAKKNFGGIMRQAFAQGSYALIDPVTWDPNPDYWLTLLFKKLVGGKVFLVTTNDFSEEKLRLYSHCANTKWYKGGSVTLYGMNLYTTNKTVHLPQNKGAEMDLYLMEPLNGDMKSRTVMLNGNILQLSPEGEIPDVFTPVKVKHSFVLPSYSYFFLVIPNAKSIPCTV